MITLIDTNKGPLGPLNIQSEGEEGRALQSQMNDEADCQERVADDAVNGPHRDDPLLCPGMFPIHEDEKEDEPLSQ